METKSFPFELHIVRHYQMVSVCQYFAHHSQNLALMTRLRLNIPANDGLRAVSVSLQGIEVSDGD